MGEGHIASWTGQEDVGIRNSFVKKTVILLLIICIVPWLLYMWFYAKTTQSMEREKVDENLNMLISEKAETLKKDIESVEDDTRNLSLWAGYFSKNQVDLSPFYQRYYKSYKNPLEGKDKETSVYFPANLALTEQVKIDAMQTEQIVPYMKESLDEEKGTACSYVVTKSGFMRVYPYLDNSIFRENLDQRTEPFYTIAGKKHNPEGTSKWTKPYYDYAGHGWITTCSVPYYKDKVMKGVICIDVQLEKLSQSIINFKLGDSGFAFLLSRQGDTIYHPVMAELNSKLGDTYEIQYGDDLNNPHQRKQLLKKMQSQEKGLIRFTDQNEEKIIAFQTIDSVDWIVGIEINKEDYFVGKEYLTVGLWAVLIIVMIVIILLSTMLSRKITTPVIAELNEYTDSLTYSQKQLESVFNSVNGTIMLVDTDYMVKKTNYNIDSGQQCHYMLNGSGRPCRNCPVDHLVKTGTGGKAEVVRGTDIFDVSAFPVARENGKIDEIVVLEENITEQKLIEKELLQKEKMAGVGQMVAGVTHELKNPLSVIKGAAYLLRHDPTGKEQKEIVEEIDHNISRAESIVYNMLDFSKVNRAVNGEIDLESLLNQILMLVRQDCVVKKIVVSMNITKGLKIKGNKEAFKHIFLNVITNGIEAMPAGGEIFVRAVSKKNNNIIEIGMSNTGEQIPEEKLEEIFQPFYTTKKEGTGLGLWIAAREIERIKGSIRAINCETGVEIILTLPGTGEEKRDENFND